MEVFITGPDDLLPSYAHPGDAGADLRSAVDEVIPPNGTKLIPTGISMALPSNVVALVHPRSGLALKSGITVLNAPGTIDSGYRGEVGVILHNTGPAAFQVHKGDRIAQLVFQKFETPTFVKVNVLNETDRGAGGFGSTGKG